MDASSTLFLARHAGHLAFASEVKALFGALRGGRRRITRHQFPEAAQHAVGPPFDRGPHIHPAGENPVDD